MRPTRVRILAAPSFIPKMVGSTQTLDSKVFFSIPRTDLSNDNYRLWIDKD